MKKTFLCPFCKVQVSTDDSNIGRKVRCPKCSQVFILSKENEAKSSTLTGFSDAPASKVSSTSPNSAQSTTKPQASPSQSTVPTKTSSTKVDDLIGTLQEELRQEELAVVAAKTVEQKKEVQQPINPFIPISVNEAVKLFGRESLNSITKERSSSSRRQSVKSVSSEQKSPRRRSAWAEFFLGDERTTYGLRNIMIASTLCPIFFYSAFWVIALLVCLDRAKRLIRKICRPEGEFYLLF